ncbi:probable CoA ligase CCL6 isoform X2 [Rosa rugosa]|uniref:probable CoA ligase CCL6 isoform X2 n=1 Tax=Rosa rugosa TaxID=74645 RepID=UPI002B413503|nr:probable CoA ligase CCL6 isoform X2 [Rosa rugosa]
MEIVELSIPSLEYELSFYCGFPPFSFYNLPTMLSQQKNPPRDLQPLPPQPQLASNHSHAQPDKHTFSISKLANLQKGLTKAKAAPLLDKLVFDKIKQELGGQVRIMLSGAAPLPRHVEEFIRRICLLNRVGLTESCGGCFTSLGNVYPMIGTVGAPLTTIEARLESVPELGYDALSSVPCGEIFLGGKTLFSGYHKRQDLTEEVLIDGWFRTGDIGGWQPNGAMKVTDRKMEVFKLSQGEYVAMESIESKYLQWPLITSIWVYGNGFESFLVAVVVPGRKALEDWAAEHHLTDDYKSLCQNLKARNYILDELNITGQKQQLRGFELLEAASKFGSDGKEGR